MKKKTCLLLKRKLLHDWDSLTHFINSNKDIPVSMETVRRAITGDKSVSAPSLLFVALHLGFEPHEVKQILIDEGDTIYSRLIVDQTGEHITARERALLVIYHKLKSKNALIDHLALIAKADGVDISKELPKLRQKGG